MESKDFERILDAMPETAVYVIREDNHEILYYNKRVHTVSPEVRHGMTCHEVWTGSCINCPLLTIKNRSESRSISYNPTFGGVVDMVATRTMWQDTIPAFVVTVTPRLEAVGSTYRKILRVDLDADSYDVLKLEPDAWLNGNDTADFSRQMELLAESGAIHPDDRERFIAFIRPEHLREMLGSGRHSLSCIYRRQRMGEFRWNLMEVVKCFDYNKDRHVVIFCIMDVHDTMREGLQREESNAHNMELICTVAEQSFRIYNIDLEQGTAAPVLIDGHSQETATTPLPSWDELMHFQITPRLHAAYQKAFEQKFSLESLRQSRTAGEQNRELLCQWKVGENYRYISVTAHRNQKEEECSHIVLAFQDMDERIRRELLHSQRDMQMAAILKSRYSKLNTVHLDSGQCEQVCLHDETELSNPLIGDYDYFMHQALYNHIHPDDAIKYSNALSLDHLRKKAAATESYSEEICQYRMKGDPVHWIEQHVIYTRKGDKVSVNILGQDITSQKRQEEAQLQALQDKSYIISGLSSLFFSTYYIDLAQDTFRAVTQLGKVGDVLGSEVNCTAALRVYADNFVHPDDHAEFFEVMNIDNWRQSLRWWNPYVTITYRKMPQGPRNNADSCRWIRATAVLAQADEDDMPKTVVYVAQDITESREKKV